MKTSIIGWYYLILTGLFAISGLRGGASGMFLEKFQPAFRQLSVNLSDEFSSKNPLQPFKGPLKTL